jgi:hypothetical protein
MKRKTHRNVKNKRKDSDKSDKDRDIGEKKKDWVGRQNQTPPIYICLVLI